MKKAKARKGGTKTVGVKAEEEVRATKRLEEQILVLQTYADELESRPVM